MSMTIMPAQTSPLAMADGKAQKLGKASRKSSLARAVKPEMYDRNDRASFASFTEDRSAFQSFVSSKVSSYTRQQPNYDEEAIESDSSEDDRIGHLQTRQRQGQQHQQKSHLSPPLTNPHSRLHGTACPCDGFTGWKGISVAGRKASKSHSDLRRLHDDFSWTPSPSSSPSPPLLKPSGHAVGQSPLEGLPIEILTGITDHLLSDIPPGGFTPRNVDLVALLLTSKTIHSATLLSLYKNITIPHSKVFRKFLTHIAANPDLGSIIRRLDFSHFNPTVTGMTAGDRASTTNLTQKTLLECLNLIPNLQEFLAQEHIDEDISTDVLRTLFSMPRLQAVDFCASSSTSFRDAISGVFAADQPLALPASLSMTRVSFHECWIVPAAFFTEMLPRLPRLTHLDVAHTRITSKALFSIPTTARLTHLNLSRCSHLSGDDVVRFLTTHPAAQSLVYLNLMMDAKSNEMLEAADLTALLTKLPPKLKSLNLKGSKMLDVHMPLLAPLTKQLEELSLGRNLTYESIASLLLPPTPAMLPTSATGPDFARAADEREAWIPHTLKYVDISDLEARDVDMTTFFDRQLSVLRHKSVLDVLELSDSMTKAMTQRAGVCRSFGWVVKGEGRRGWLVKEPEVIPKLLVYQGLSANHWAEPEPEEVVVKDCGARPWKMGAQYWGMRKVPVATQEVGGMYGLYMFKR